MRRGSAGSARLPAITGTPGRASLYDIAPAQRAASSSDRYIACVPAARAAAICSLAVGPVPGKERPPRTPGGPVGYEAASGGVVRRTRRFGLLAELLVNTAFLTIRPRRHARLAPIWRPFAAGSYRDLISRSGDLAGGFLSFQGNRVGGCATMLAVPDHGAGTATATSPVHVRTVVAPCVSLAPVGSRCAALRSLH